VRPGHGTARRDLVLRVYPGPVACMKAAREYEALCQLYRAGYPVPEVLWLELDSAALGRPFIIMERVPGEPMWRQLVGAQDNLRDDLLRQFCGLFVALHRLDWRRLGSEIRGADAAARLGSGPYGFVDCALGELHWMGRHHPLPGFAPVLAWLAAHHDEVPCRRPAPVHHDFHPNNILCRPDGSAVVIDWTGLIISDPRLDLAWTLLLLGSHGLPAHRDAALSEYERQWGVPVERLEYFDVLACARRLGSVALSFLAGPETLSMREDAREAMRGQFPALSRVADLLEARTGLRIPEFDSILAANG
jgi:aminoglycoside phosphotransferase (APT) family kinase protein